MKPRIRIRFGIWSCTTNWTPAKQCWCVGYGYSPKAAYDDWLQQQ